MMDIVSVLATFAAFALALSYITGCDRLMGTRS